MCVVCKQLKFLENEVSTEYRSLYGNIHTGLRLEISLHGEVQPGTDGLVEPAQQTLVQQRCVVAVLAPLLHALRDLCDEHCGRELFDHRVEIEGTQLPTHRRVLRDVRGVLCLEQFSELDVIALVLGSDVIDQGKVTRQIGAQQVIQLRCEV